MEIVEVWAPPSGVLGVLLQFVFLVTFIGALPVALLGLVLAVWTRRRAAHWSAPWSNIFQAAVLFQAGSLVSSILVLWLLWREVDSADLRNEWSGPIGIFVGAVSLNLAGCAFGLNSWRWLRATVSEKQVEVP